MKCHGEKDKDNLVIGKEEREKINSQIAKLAALHQRWELWKYLMCFYSFWLKKLLESSCITSLAVLSYWQRQTVESGQFWFYNGFIKNISLSSQCTSILALGKPNISKTHKA